VARAWICTADLMVLEALAGEPVGMSDQPAFSHRGAPFIRVLIAGGGVAALETLLALRDLAGERVSTTLLAPQPTFTSNAMSVARLFARGRPQRVDLAEAADEVVCDSLAEVEADAGRVRCVSGEVLEYDQLVLAVGAKSRRAWSHGITLGMDSAEEELHSLLEEIERGYVGQVAFVVPGGTVWPLPLYELAIMTARQAWSMGMDRVRFTLVTPEERPLAIFGRAASEGIAELLDGCGIEFIGSAYASVGHGWVQLEAAGRRLSRTRVVSLPVLEGPDLPGVPTDPTGFIPADQHGRVPGLPRVYAAGDGTTFPIKQGGLATQQADAVAESIAAAVGACVTPEPFRPVLRAMLLTGGDTRYLQHMVAGGAGDGDMATHELWWPPAKLAGRYLSPYLLQGGHAPAVRAPQLARSG
jgi:sulfide:quinone oxidoreductase